MSKESIRDKIDKLKAESKEILKSDQMSNETRLFINSILMMLDIVVEVLLFKKVKKTSRNSGLPPSKGFGSNGNRNKAGDSETDKKGSQVPNTKNTTEEIYIPIDTCNHCHKDLSSEKIINKETREEIDIIYEIKRKKVTVEVKNCSSCFKMSKAKFPKGMDGKLQYGIGVKAAIINYLMVQMFSYERCSEHFKGLIGRFISQATMLKYVMSFYLSLSSWEEEKITEILKSPAIHVDETSIRINKVNYWVHVYSYGNISLQFVHKNRGKKAVDEINIIPRYGGIIIHDCWATYFSYKDVSHALCGSHILRELIYTMESEVNGAGWAMIMIELLKEAAEAVYWRPDTEVLEEEEYQKLQFEYREILNYALSELPDFPKKGKNGKGRPKHTEAQNLYLRLKKHEDSVLMFARVKEVNFTNNRAERDVRTSKTKQKVSGGFRVLKYAKAYIRIISFIKSKRYEGYSSFEAINMKLAE